MPLNFEMAATEEMIPIAVRTQPHAACLVPERRSERTTEGGLDVAGQQATLKPAVAELKKAGIRVSLFIAAETRPDRSGGRSRRAGDRNPYRRLVRCGRRRPQGPCRGGVDAHPGRREAGASLGLEVHAGHGLNYETAERIAALPEIVELNIGHFLIGEAVAVGLETAVRAMREAMDARPRGERDHDPRPWLRHRRCPPHRAGH